MIYFIRHAQSQFNSVQKKLSELHGVQYLESEQFWAEKYNPSYMDAEITENGIKQAQQAAKRFASQHVDLVIVSPMKRALSTCDIIFKNHKSQPPIIVMPQFRQILESIDDVGFKLIQSQKMFKFDFSQITDKQAWFVHTIKDEEIRGKMLSELKGLVGEERLQRSVELTLAFMKKNWIERVKSKHNQQIKLQVLPCYEQQTKILKELLNQYKSIAVVAHCQCIKRYSGYKIQNCQIFPFQAQRL